MKASFSRRGEGWTYAWSVVLFSFCATLVQAAPPWLSRPKHEPTAVQRAHRPSARVRLNYFRASWDRVFQDLAAAGGLTLVMPKAPNGHFARHDSRTYTLDQALRVLNAELEPQGFRAFVQNGYLLVLPVDLLRARYTRPILRPEQPTVASSSVRPEQKGRGRTDVRTSAPLRQDAPVRVDVGNAASLGRATALRAGTAAHSHPATSRAARPVSARAAAESARVVEQSNSPVRPVQHAVRVVERTGHEQPAPQRQAEPVTLTVQVRTQSAVNVSRAIFEAYRSRAELVNDGPNGLPGFVVYARSDAGSPPAEAKPTSGSSGDSKPGRPSGLRRTVQFAVGIDTENNRLVVQAPEPLASGVAQLIRLLDREPRRSERAQFVPSDQDVKKIAEGLQPAVRQLVAAQSLSAQAAAASRAGSSGPAQPQRPVLAAPSSSQAQSPAQQPAAARPTTSLTAAQAAAQPPASQPPAAQPQTQPSEAQTAQPGAARPQAVIGGLKGEVTIEYIPGVGFVLRGNEEDVAKVEAILKMIEQVGVGAAPNIRLYLLKHVNSAALAELLTNVYQQLDTIKGLSRNQTTVGFIPVGKPNALLIVAAQEDLPGILDLIDQLDQPVDPRTEFAVFRLKNAIASQVVEMLDSFYEDRTGLEARVRAVADMRTNTVVVQAEPSDMREVASLIQKIDQEASEAVNDIKVFPLKNAVAEELANLLNQAIQSVLSPPSFALGAAGLGQLGLAATARTAQELQETKSAILQFLYADGGKQKVYRSGILADIRVTPDPRTNSVIVTAPPESMGLMEALITYLDRPAEQVAQVKIFTLQNAQASSVVDILNNLFQDLLTVQQGQSGVRLAGTEDATSTLIGLRLEADARTNSIIAVGGEDALSMIEAIILRLDQGNLRERRTEVVRLKNSQAEDVVAAINEFRDSLRALEQSEPGLISPYELLEEEIIAVAEPVTNSVLLSVTPRYFDDVLKLVEKLDKPPEQVIIQALIVEVELDDTDEFGVELGFQDPILFDRSLVVNGVLTPGFNFNNTDPLGNASGTSRTSRIGVQGISNFALGRGNTDLGFGGLVISAASDSVNVLVRALASNRHVEILSRPQIRTVEGQEAVVQVVSEVPRINGFSSNAFSGVAVPLVEFTDVGIILRVTPQVTPDDRIYLQVAAEKSQLLERGIVLTTDASGRPIESPVKDTKTAVANIIVNNNQTVVLGGIITNEDTTVTRKVPWLGDVPVLGRAFRFDRVETSRKELLIFLTPRVIHNDEEDEMIKQIEMERLHFVQDLAEELHGPLTGFSPPSQWQTPWPAPPAPEPTEPPQSPAPPPSQPELPAPANSSSDQTSPNQPQQPTLLPKTQTAAPLPLRQTGQVSAANGARQLEGARLTVVGAYQTARKNHSSSKKPRLLNPLRHLKGKEKRTQ